MLTFHPFPRSPSAGLRLWLRATGDHHQGGELCPGPISRHHHPPTKPRLRGGGGGGQLRAEDALLPDE